MIESFKFIERIRGLTKRPRLNALIALLALSFFAFDLLMPLGIAAGIPYVSLIFLSTRYNNRRAIHIIAFISSLLTILGLLLSPIGGTLWAVITNRLLALLTIWATAFLVNKSLSSNAGRRIQSDRLISQTNTAHNILNENDLNKVLTTICDEACHTLRADRALIEKTAPIPGGHYEITLIVEKNLPTDFKATIGARSRPNSLLASILKNLQIMVLHPDEDPRTLEVQRQAGHKTICNIPILAHGAPFGILILYHLKKREYNEDDYELAHSFGELASLAVEKSLDIELAEARANRLAIINKITKSIGSELDSNKIFNTVASEIRDLIDGDRCVVGKVDPNTMKISHWHEDAEKPIPINAKGKNDALWWYDDVYIKNRVANIADFAEVSSPRAQGFVKAGLRSGVIVPILKGEVCIAHLSVTRKAANAFSPEDEELLSAIAEHLGIAIQNAELFKETETQLAHLELIRAFSEQLSTHSDLQSLFEFFTLEGKHFLHADRSAICLINPNGQRHFLWQDGLSDTFIKAVESRVNPRPGTQVTEESESIFVRDVLNDPRTAPMHDVMRGEGYFSVLHLPLRTETDSIGVASFYFDTDVVPTENQIKMAQTFTDYASVAISKSKLFAEVEERAAQLEVSKHISEAIGSKLKPDDLFKAITREIQKIVPCDRFSLASFDIEKKLYSFFYEDAIFPMGIPIHQGSNSIGLLVKLYENMRAINIPNIQDNSLGGMRHLQNGYKSLLAIPIHMDKGQIAHMILASTVINGFSDSQEKMLTSIAPIIAPALRNAELYRESQKRADNLALVNEISKVVGGELKPDELFKSIVTQIRNVVSCERCVIMSFNPKDESFQYLHVDGNVEINNTMGLFLKDRPWLKELYEKMNPEILRDLSEYDTQNSQILLAAGLRCALNVPILQNDLPIGHIGLARSVVDSFTDEDVELLKLIASHFGPAIQNARLYEQSQEQAEKISLIGEISRAVSAELEPKAVFSAIVKEIRNALPCERCVITGYDTENDDYVNWYMESDHDSDATPLKGNKGFARWLQRNMYELKKSMTINDVYDPSLEWDKLPENIWFKSMMFVPIVQDDRAIAHVTISSSSPGAFSYEQKEFMTSVAGHLGPAIRNATLYEQSLAYTERLKALNAVSRKITEVLDIDQILMSLVESAKVLLQSERATIYLRDDSTKDFVLRAESGISASTTLGMRLKPGEGLSGIVIEEARPQIIESGRETVISSLREWFINNNLQSYIGVPCWHEDELIGVISCVSTRSNFYKEEDIEILAAFASQAAVAIQNAKLFQTIEDRSTQLAEAQRIARIGNWQRDIDSDFAFWSDEIYRIFGLEPQEKPITLSVFFEFIHPDDREGVQEIVYRALANRESYNMDFRIVRSDGIERIIHNEGRIILDDEGRPISFVGTNQDVTEQKRAEAEIRALNEELEARVEARTQELRNAQAELLKNERLATLGQLTATVSHEIRNPLGTMRTSTYVLAKKIQTNDIQVKNAIERIDRSITRCDHIIDEFLDFTRTRELQLKNELIDSWLEELIDEQNIPGGVALRCELQSPGVMAPIDSERLRRAFINIFENAHQAMISPKDLTKIIDGATLTVETRVSSDRLGISISNTGPGMPPEVLEKIFEPLYSTKNFGVGLGLPTAKQILDQHGGEIEIETGDGEGTRFTLWLPLAPAEEKAHI
jgi:PAS domain S-box-containing protein